MLRIFGVSVTFTYLYMFGILASASHQTRFIGPGVKLHVRARFSDLDVNSILPLPTSRADIEPPKGVG